MLRSRFEIADLVQLYERHRGLSCAHSASVTSHLQFAVTDFLTT